MENKKLRSLTGIKPTGMPHVGNWLGAIKPALDLMSSYEALYFIADYHAMTTIPASSQMKKDTYSVAASWLALGLDPEKVIFYRQSDVPQIFELSWFLSCFTPKGFMNRAHGYKDRLAVNSAATKDPDEGVNMGFFAYPVLMSADILLFSADVVPIGNDQKQHLEFARDIAERVNGFYKSPVFTLPEPKITENAETVVGLDGRKMSKSYGNTIPLFIPEKQLKSLIMKIVTNSQTPEDPKDPESSYIYSIHKLFLPVSEKESLAGEYKAGGMGWGKAKTLLFEVLNEHLKGPREEYDRLTADPGYLDEILKRGAEKAGSIAAPFMENLRKVAGISN